MKFETYALGIDLGGSSIKAVAVTPAGQTLSRHNLGFDPNRKMEWAQNVRLLTLGTGVGGAAMVDGRLLRGHLGQAAHLGHTTLDPEGPPDCVGTPGSLEVAIGNCTIQERSRGRFQTTHDLIAAHRKG